MQRRPIPGASKRHTNRARARSLRRRTRSAARINNAGLNGADTGTASEFFFFFSLSLRGCSVSATQVVVGKHGKGERVGGREAHYLWVEMEKEAAPKRGKTTWCRGGGLEAEEPKRRLVSLPRPLGGRRCHKKRARGCSAPNRR